MQLHRSSGVLMHVSSLYGSDSIGGFGQEAREFIDFLADCGFGWWQVLPFCMSDEYNSPYKSFSAFGGNPYFVDIRRLREEGLLSAAEVEAVRETTPFSAEYGYLYRTRLDLLRRAAERTDAAERARVAAFLTDNPYLAQFCDFMARRRANGDLPWCRWQDAAARDEQEYEAWGFIQYRFMSQWQAIHDYAAHRGVKILGDMPIYVSYDSCDVFANREQFLLDAAGAPTAVAGWPPDYFARDGQLWGNPLYDWDAMKDDGYRWWIERVRNQLDQVDYIRIDHFRGFEAYWAVPAGEETAMNGKWKKGPGEALFEAIQKALGEELPIFAEDLGIITPEVEKLRDTLGFPGMKILQFGFDGTGESTFLPHQLSTRNCICYTGTHDNDTTCGWYEHTNEQNKDKVRRYMNTDASSVSWDFIRTCLGTIAKYAIFPVQDLLKLGSEHRMNTPGTATGNWEFRYRSGLLDEGMAKGLKQMTELFGRWG